MTDLAVGVSPPMDLFSRSHEERLAWVRDVESAGLDHVFIADHVSFRGGQGIDALTYLAALGGMSGELGLYAGVLLLALRHPMVAARQINQLAQVAPDRVTIGVGVGGEDRHEFEVCGIDPSTRGRRTDSALSIVRRLLDGEVVDHTDDFFALEDARILPPIESRVPVVVGGRSDAAVRRAGTLGDGWLASWCSARRFGEGVTLAESAARAAGRSPEWRHGLQIWVGTDDEPERATRFVAEGMEGFYRLPFDAFARYTPVGSAGHLVEYLTPYVEAGARVLNLTPRGASTEAELEIIGATREALLRRFDS